MQREHTERQHYIGYEYKRITVSRDLASLYADGYQNFGWVLEGIEENRLGNPGTAELRLKRDRKLRNKAEVTRLQRQFEACAASIVTLERSKTTRATIAAIGLGLVGCAFMAGSTFAYLGGLIALCVVLAVPGFTAWLTPYLLYRLLYTRRVEEITPLIEQKYDEIYEVCERANALIS